jgi:hypothetical protein
MPATKNLMGKTRKVNDPYAIWVRDGWEWRVLKHYQAPQKEADNQYARCFCAVKGSGTFDGFDLGDTYIRDYESVAYPLTETEMVEWLAKPENHWREY